MPLRDLKRSCSRWWLDFRTKKHTRKKINRYEHEFEEIDIAEDDVDSVPALMIMVSTYEAKIKRLDRFWDIRKKRNRL